MVVYGVTRAGLREVVAKRGVTEKGFRVRAEGAESAAPAVGTVAVAMTSLLAMQEDESEVKQDRAARRQGEAMLDGLSELQGALLGSGEPDLGRLAQLVERPVTASDPGLAGILRAVRLRAGIELARRGAVEM